MTAAGPGDDSGSRPPPISTRSPPSSAAAATTPPPTSPASNTASAPPAPPPDGTVRMGHFAAGADRRVAKASPAGPRPPRSAANPISLKVQFCPTRATPQAGSRTLGR